MLKGEGAELVKTGLWRESDPAVFQNDGFLLGPQTQRRQDCRTVVMKGRDISNPWNWQLGLALRAPGELSCWVYFGSLF